MLWLLGRSQIDKKTIATIAVEFAETCVHNAKDYPAFAECITTVKKYLSGQATQEELAAAESSALAAADSAAEADNCEIIRKHVSADEICKLFRKDGVE